MPADVSQLQPDLAWYRPRADNYFGGHPSANDVLLVVKLADTSADDDRSVKAPLHGSGGIAVSWLVDLVADVIERYRQPSQSGYGEKQTCAPGSSLVTSALADVVLIVSAILGTPT